MNCEWTRGTLAPGYNGLYSLPVPYRCSCDACCIETEILFPFIKSVLNQSEALCLAVLRRTPGPTPWPLLHFGLSLAETRRRDEQQCYNTRDSPKRRTAVIEHTRLAEETDNSDTGTTLALALETFHSTPFARLPRKFKIAAPSHLSSDDSDRDGGGGRGDGSGRGSLGCRHRRVGRSVKRTLCLLLDLVGLGLEPLVGALLSHGSGRLDVGLAGPVEGSAVLVPRVARVAENLPLQ